MTESFKSIPDTHGHAKGEHPPYASEQPVPYTARMLFLWFYQAARRGFPRDLMVTDHTNLLCPGDPQAVHAARAALHLAENGDIGGAAELARVSKGQAETVCDALRSGMRFSIGLEVDNDPRNSVELPLICEAFEPDGIVRSVHFLAIEHPQDGGQFNWPFDNPEFASLHELLGAEKTWQLYMRELLTAVRTGPGDILAHFYVPALFGHWPAEETMRDYEDQILDACAERGMAVELNARFLYRDHSEEQKAAYLNVHERFLRKAVAKNVGIAVGSDAHSPGDQGRAFEQVLPLLDRAGVAEFVFPVRGTLTRVPRVSGS